MIDASDAEIRDAITDDLDRALGLREDPNYLEISRWRQAIPQPDRHHARRMKALDEELVATPRLTLAGGYLRGISVGDTLLSGARAAERVSATLRTND